MAKDKYDRIITYLNKNMLSVVDFKLNNVQQDIPIKAARIFDNFNR